MLLWSWMVSSAHAGPTVQVMGGAAVPLAIDSASSTGPLLGLIGGYRAKLGPIALQPEAVARWNLDASTVSLGAGAELTMKVAGPLRIGPYAHMGVGIVPNPGPSPDAGLSIVINPPSPVVIGARAGWQWDHPALYKCGDCPQPAEHWLSATVTAGVLF